MTKQSNDSYTFYQKQKPSMKYKKTIIAIGVIVGVVGGVTIATNMNTEHTAKAVHHYQVKDAKTKHQLATKEEREKVVSTDYSGNAAISSLSQIKKYRSLPGQLYLVGYIAIPKQNGVTNPVTTMQINEGMTNKVLAYGAGTVKPGQTLGKRNFSLAAHNYGDNKTGFSPLQSSIDVDKQPNAYLSDGKKVYTYQFNKKSDAVTGNTVVNYKNISVASDERVKDKNLLTLITCDEPGIFNLHPANRKVLTAHLVSIKSVTETSQSVQQLFLK